MFSLIVTLIAVLLVTALALATVYYGGNAFMEQRTKARAAQVVTEGQQIAAAVDLYRSRRNQPPPDMASLTANGEYLSSAPNVDWTFATDYVVYPIADLDACKKANAMLKLGLTEVPLCSAVTGKTICCQKDE